MCTLTIHREADRLLVTMNRDEQRSRPQEAPPFYWKEQNLFAPQDTKGSGTWAAISDKGIIACLLNGYRSQDQGLDIKISRGDIIPFILNQENPFEAAENIDAKNYASFVLYVISQEIAFEYSWDGKSFNISELDKVDWLFFTSSSYLQSDVKTCRYQDFQNWEQQGALFKDMLPTIHVSQNHENRAFNTLMSRDDACTKSITQFEVSNNKKTVRYWPQPYVDLGMYEEFAV